MYRLLVAAACLGYLLDGIHGALSAVIVIVALELLLALLAFAIGRPVNAQP